MEDAALESDKPIHAARKRGAVKQHFDLVPLRTAWLAPTCEPVTAMPEMAAAVN
jgi:hypothetical protein